MKDAQKPDHVSLNTFDRPASRWALRDARRGLEGSLTNKALWPLSAARFASKAQLVTPIGRRADLRNGIRHGRAVDELTREEGEAAVPWFQQVPDQ